MKRALIGLGVAADLLALTEVIGVEAEEGFGLLWRFFVSVGILTMAMIFGMLALGLILLLLERLGLPEPSESVGLVVGGGTGLLLAYFMIRDQEAVFTDDGLIPGPIGELATGIVGMMSVVAVAFLIYEAIQTSRQEQPSQSSAE